MVMQHSSENQRSSMPPAMPSIRKENHQVNCWILADLPMPSRFNAEDLLPARWAVSAVAN